MECLILQPEHRINMELQAPKLLFIDKRANRLTSPTCGSQWTAGVPLIPSSLYFSTFILHTGCSLHMCTTNHAERLVLVLSSYLTEKPGVQILSPALFPRQLTKLSHLATLCMCIRQGNTNALTKTGRFKLLFLNLFLGSMSRSAELPSPGIYIPYTSWAQFSVK
jgi:hypothetical protein